MLRPLTDILTLRPGVGQNTATHASPTDRYSHFKAWRSEYRSVFYHPGVGPRNKIGHPATDAGSSGACGI